MKYLLVATALTLGFCGTCWADFSTQNAKGYVYTDVKPQYPFSAQSLGLGCHMQGRQQICKPVSSA